MNRWVLFNLMMFMFSMFAITTAEDIETRRYFLLLLPIYFTLTLVQFKKDKYED